jgi:hypothetical protein
MIKSIVITLLMMELLSETAVVSKVPTTIMPAAVEFKVPTMPYNGQGQCLTAGREVIEC